MTYPFAPLIEEMGELSHSLRENISPSLFRGGGLFLDRFLEFVWLLRF